MRTYFNVDKVVETAVDLLVNIEDFTIIQSFRHRGAPCPNHHWDTLEDEVELEEFDLSQPHSQTPIRQRPLAALGLEAHQGRQASPGGGRGRGGRGGRGSRGGRGRRGSQPADRAGIVQQLDRRALSILKKGKQPAPRRRETQSQPNESAAIDYDHPVAGPSSQSRKRRADFIDSDSD